MFVDIFQRNIFIASRFERCKIIYERSSDFVNLFNFYIMAENLEDQTILYTALVLCSSTVMKTKSKAYFLNMNRVSQSSISLDIPDLHLIRNQTK